ncbi:MULTISPECIES: TonB-dependent receptor domain-containing protein [unclassified Sphingomonas]|uniref:TonB-dependent receptor n=1 Tax=unclassified Sphingomonas TaxID=196159 RepID=UPI002859B91E|nr:MULTISPECIES: TonB-dependent receptor [unclassified Sphingomonas]MDR6115378.1 iron complex outermembrane receptor protein [Sphingomonas sp. SORGH_AS_0789]MDR6150947.1 iron complex outermembrane receptor protein [Sphingomonas sp. SORGH_AS_0742]
MALVALAMPSAARAQPQDYGDAATAPRRIVLAPATLDFALRELARQAGITIVATDDRLNRVRTSTLHLTATPARALDRLLRGTGYRAVAIDSTSFRVVGAPRTARPTKIAHPKTVPPPATNGQDIIVTASKQGTALARYPGSVSVVGRGVTLPAGSINLSDVAAQTPILQTTALGPGRNKLFIRGIADSSFNGATESTASLYLDDVQIAFAGPDPGLKLYDIGSVEVAEGPQGALHGSGAIGGIIRLTSNPVSLDRDGGHVEIGGALTTHGAPSADMALVANLVAIPQTLGLRVVGYRGVTGGYIDNSRTKRTDINRVLTNGGRATLRLAPGDGWRVELGGGAQSIVARDAQYVTHEDSLVTRAAIPQPSWSDMSFGRILLSKDWASGLQFVSATGLVDGASFENFDASAVGAVESYQLSSDKALFSHESRLSRRLPGGGSWVLGINLVSDQSVMGRSLTIRQGVRPVIGVTNVTRSGAIFGEATHPVTRALWVTLGGRVTLARVDGEPSITPRSGQYVRGRSTARVDPTLGFTWQPGGDWTLFGRYQSGFRTGGLAVAAGVGRVANFDPDSIAMVELGLRHLRRGDTGLSASVSVSRANWRSIQADLLGRGGQPATSNIGDARVDALEGWADWVPQQDWHINAALFLTDNRVTGSTAMLSRARNRRLPETPSISARLGVIRDLRVAPELTLSARVDAAFVGPSVLGVGDMLDVRQGGYGVVDAGLTARHGRYALALTVDNLLDERGNRFAFGNPILLGRHNVSTPVRPRTMGLRLSADF